jgi:N-acetyl-gamma-glutamyl-phosphate reductase
MNIESENARKTLDVGIFGASGTTGAELARLIDEHPACTVKHATSRSHAGKSLRTVDPSAADLPLVHPDDVTLEGLDVAFVCLPHGHAAPFVEKCAEAGVKTIDLSGDLRLRDEELHAQFYGTPRSEKIAAKAVYGLTEVSRDDIAKADVVSNPGCYPTCSAIALYPLAERGLLPDTVVVDAKSGISGAGRNATATTHFCSVADDVRPYKLGRSHRHAAEIEQTISTLGKRTARVVFCPHVVPLERGLLVTIVVDVGVLTPSEVHDLYADTYGDEPLIEVLPMDTPARIRAVARTNGAVVSIHPVVGTRHVVITCAIDNLRKGAAGQAVQNMNLMFGLPEVMGLAPAPARGWPTLEGGQA